MHTTTNTVLILGARGRFGLTAARAFAEAGWRVLGQMRSGAQAPKAAGIEWLGIDLDNTKALAQAAQGRAPAETGPAHGPRPASSTPHTSPPTRAASRVSSVRVGMVLVLPVTLRP